MNLVELTKSLNQLRLGGMAAVVETRILQAQSEKMAPIDFIGALVSDELERRCTRLIERRMKQAEFRDPQRTLDNFDFDFNKKINRRSMCAWRVVVHSRLGREEEVFCRRQHGAVVQD